MRRFDEREVAEILRIATEPRDARALSRVGSGEGLTLEEVKDVAVEAGIDPARIEEAANRLTRPAPTSKLDAFVGSPTNVRYEAEYEVELDETGRAAAVRLIRATLDRQGVVGGVGDDVEWMDQDGFGGRNVTLTRTARGTRVTIAARFHEAGGGAAGVTGVTGTVGAVGTALVVAGSGPIGWLLAPVTLAAMYAVPRLTIGSVVRRETRRLADLADRLRDLMSANEPSN
ncbi:MAG: hypothetical protein OEU54_13735 [Gemmatimonadota bacterium]|nr:hypothetical protein [Gemmatimonadota bacterium]